MTVAYTGDLKWRNTDNAKKALHKLERQGYSNLADILDWNPWDMQRKVRNSPYVWEELSYALLLSDIPVDASWKSFIDACIIHDMKFNGGI